MVDLRDSTTSVPEARRSKKKRKKEKKGRTERERGKKMNERNKTRKKNCNQCAVRVCASMYSRKGTLLGFTCKRNRCG